MSSGSASALGTPKEASIGPTPRTRTCLPLPETTKPTVSAWLPGPDKARAEKFTIRLEGPAAIEIVSTEVVVPRALVALSVTLDVPAIVGVPLIAPVRGLRVRPAGRPVAA